MTTPPPRSTAFRHLPIPPRLAAAGVVALRLSPEVDQWAVDTLAGVYARPSGVVVDVRDAAVVSPKFVTTVVDLVSDQEAEPWTQWSDEVGIFGFCEVYRLGYLRATKELQAAEHPDRSWDELFALSADVNEVR